MSPPSSVELAAACGDTLTLSWHSVAGATAYETLQLGSVRMDSIGWTTDTFFVQTGLQPFQSQWYAVRAVTANGQRGRRSNAVNIHPIEFTCTYDHDLAVEIILEPLATQSICYFDTLRIQLRNAGRNFIESGTIHFSFDAGQHMLQQPLSDTLAPNESVIMAIPNPFSFVPGQSHRLDVYAEYAPDANSYNDSLGVYFIVENSQSLPYQTDFNNQTLCGYGSNCELPCALSNGWTNPSDDDTNWRVIQGPTPSEDTGPQRDFDSVDDQGRYLYLEASTPCQALTGHLVSPCLDLSQLQEPVFQFAYHLYGSNMGSLHVDLFDGTQWHLDYGPPVIGDQGNRWHLYHLDLQEFKHRVIKVRLRGITGSDYRSDMAVDLLRIGESVPPGCPTISAPADNQTQVSPQTPLQWEPVPYAAGYLVTIGTTPGGTDVLPSTDVGLVNQYFIQNIAFNTSYYWSVGAYNAVDTISCATYAFTTGAPLGVPACETVEAAPTQSVGDWNWDMASTSGYRWQVGTNETPSSNTGPAFAGDGQGFFFTEASYGVAGDVTTLTSPELFVQDTFSDLFVAFDYPFHGSGIHRMSVDVQVNGVWHRGAYAIEGEQQIRSTDAWGQTGFSLQPYLISGANSVYLRFVGIRGGSFAGDMALDNICLAERSEFAASCSAFTFPANGATGVPVDEAILAWDVNGLVSRFQLKVGTTSGGSDIIDQNVGLGTSYQLPDLLDFGTDYYATIIPYQDSQPLTDCATLRFTTERPELVEPCETVSNTYCYGNDETALFVYQSADPAQALLLSFDGGTIEAGFDRIDVYDGLYPNGVLLYSGDNGGDLTNLQVAGDQSFISLRIVSDVTVNCLDGDGCCNTPMEWTVQPLSANNCGHCDPNDPNQDYVHVTRQQPDQPNIAIGIHHASVELTADNGTVISGDYTIFKGGSSVRLLPGFAVQSGAIFRAEIEACHDEPANIRADSVYGSVPVKLAAAPRMTIRPNPFAQQTDILLLLENADRYDLSLYDQLGRVVQSVFRQQLLPSGTHFYSLNGSDLPPGVYFLRLSSRKTRVVRKVVRTR